MDLFPSLPLAGWAGSKETVHRFLQVVGKIRLGASVRRNHWWNVPFYVTGRGLTTRPMWSAGRDAIFAIDLDLVAHDLQINHLDGRRVSIPLTGQSVASFHDRTHEALQGLGIEVSVPRDTPFDLPDSGRPFGQDAEHDIYDPVAVNTYWRVLSQVSLILELFSAGYSGKVSPVHHFWHTFDIAVTRFSDRRIDFSPDVDSVTREAYSREVISAGFWFGDSQTPSRPSIPTRRPNRWRCRSAAAAGVRELAVPRIRSPGGAALRRRPRCRGSGGDDAGLLESAYQAGARLAGGTPLVRRVSGGITDPVLLAAHE